ncbi:glucose-6-phosphate isomerase [Brenneria izadpanahii]|uniref:glucose-6-phosphate isomerase n=1 Tax=Brenneria izadpanahii TaxID=2722756 RepID=A0ABX7UTX9_9GAMM|nr:glucose-6-phosphate isomerase family protein [Brenneria izadpanahii]QTF09146.1 glucose-6-phosphate isomerase [Brenneria izadpanahii]
MNEPVIMPPRVAFPSGRFAANNVIRKVTRRGDLAGVFSDDAAWRSIPADTPIYQVEMLDAPQQEGELFVGTTRLQPGRVGDEFYMTRGHFHQRREQAEIYVGLGGAGLLLLQTEQGQVRIEQAGAGSVHHIPPFTAHRLVNTGDEILVLLAVWPAVAGHDYAALAGGFAVRIKADGKGWRAEKNHG